MALSASLQKFALFAQVRDYRAGWLAPDVAAGLSIAAVSLPTAIAYPAIAGLPTETGLFATIFGLVGYALLGPSRQLMVGPDAATCIVLAGVLTSLGAVGADDRLGVTIALTIAVGLFCFAAGALRFGFLANFLSRPMLVGFMSGISITLLIGQIKRFTAIPIQSEGLFRPLAEFASHVRETHLPTLAVGVGTLALLRVLRRLAPALPAPLLATVAGIGLSAVLDFRTRGIAVVGDLPPMSFSLSMPSYEMAFHLDFLGGALAIMLIGFGSGIICARSFAMKSRSTVNADKELYGFGAANIAAGLFGGFPVTASDSRTAVNFAIGGKTQLAALVAAGALAFAVLYIADVLAFLPTAVLGAILVSAAIDLIDLHELRALRRISPAELLFALITMLGVVVVGVLQGVFIAIAATLGHMLWSASYPRMALLGRIPGTAGLYKLHRYPEAEAIPGLTVVVLQSALVFFNADFVRRRLLKIGGATRATSKWLVLDAAAINVLDSTGVGTLEEVRARLADQGIAFGIADLNSGARRIVERSGLRDRLGPDMIFNSAEAAVDAYEATAGADRRT